MKSRYQFRIYPTRSQRQSLARLFGCVRVVWNDALDLCKHSEKLPQNSERQKACITQAKKTQKREWLTQVSNIPLQQSVADLGVAFKNFFQSRAGKRKGKKVNPPRFKGKTNRQTAQFTLGGFKVKAAKVYLAKIGDIKTKWSRPISQAGWREFRSLCEAKADKHNRDFRVISRWEPTSQVCSLCGYRWGKIHLSIRTIVCVNCGVEHDRDNNASVNIERAVLRVCPEVGVGHTHDYKRTGSACKTSHEAVCNELSTPFDDHPEKGGVARNHRPF